MCIRDRRNFFRQKLGIENRFVLGNVGNFLYSKNHPFLIDTFYELHRQQPNSVLLLIGDGPELEPTRQKVQQLRLTDSVLFLGRKNTADGYYNAMDAFILPSHFEGLSIVTIEAQFNHLPC